MNKDERLNRTLWDELTTVHLKSYDVEGFKKGRSTIDSIQIKEIGPVMRKKMLHLQCHFGLDTLSWAREGAIMTGVDFSEKAIIVARKLSRELSIPAKFINCNIFDLKRHLRGKFDIVYTSKGVLCWLRDIQKWAETINYSLKAGGVFYLMESHPFANVFDDENTIGLEVKYPYLVNKNPVYWKGGHADYSASDYIVKQGHYEWHWTVSDILNALIRAGLKIVFFNEYDRLFHKAVPFMKRARDGWYYLPKSFNKIPLMFTLKAIKTK